MNYIIFEKFSKLQRQSAVGSIILFVESIRKNSYNFLFLLYPILKGNFEISILILTAGLIILAISAYIKYYYFKYKFDFKKDEFVVKKGLLRKTKLSIPFEKIQQININQKLIHKIFKLYEIQIDTAGTNSTEVDIKAVSKKIADDFKLIAEEIKKSSLLVSQTKKRLVQETKSFEIDLITLVKTGLTTRYFETLTLIGGFIFIALQFLDDLKIDYTSGVTSWVKNKTFSFTMLIILAAITIILVLSINLVSTIVKYYKYKAIRRLKNLEINFGLIHTKSVLLSPAKVQQFHVTQNWLQKLMKIVDVSISQASSDGITMSKNRNKLHVPGCSYTQKEELFDFVYENLVGETMSMRPNIRKFYINLFLSVAPCLLIAIINLEIPFIDYINLSAITGLFITLSTLICWRSFKNNQLFISSDFIILKSGFWDIKTRYIQCHKIQSIVLTQPVWYKNSNLGNMTVLTAGGKIRFQTFDFGKLKTILNNIAYRVEISKKKWM